MNQQTAMRKIHISWHIAWAALGVVAGAALAPKLPPVFADTAWMVIGCSVLVPVLIKRNAALVLAALAAGMTIGAWRGGLERSALNDYQQYLGQTVKISGMVAEDASYAVDGSIRLRLKEVSINDAGLTGKVWASSSSKLEIKRGDQIELSGSLSKGFGTLPAAMYRAQVISVTRPHPGDLARQARDEFSEGVHHAIPSTEKAALGLGFLTGQKQGLPEQLAEQIRTVGLAHVVVASGFHLTLLVGFVRRPFTRLSKYLATLTGGLMIGGFSLVTGFTPSMSRAGLVSALSLLAWHYGRAFQPAVLLALAAAVTVLINPAYVWGDAGWALSFAAFAGVIILAPLIHRYFWGNKKPSILRSLLITTIAAQITTLPIIASLFHQYSPYSLLANLLVVPLVPLAMLFTFLAGIVGLIAPGIAVWIGWPAGLILTYCTGVINWISELPGAASEVEIGSTTVATGYVLIVLATLYLWRKTGHNFRQSDQSQERANVNT
ncbi:MAG: ComEC/Rec2 family competence protein [Candidatus Saccharimonadales bacterium]